ncbi:hypothetical protein ACTWP4_15380 [Gracilibacillus sp. D59]|uniref:hypothetical protein n=1 Tax=Gracilibacillus sp. D59 TaxID=3457434 RepID=UPI003FCD11F1
MLSVMASNKVKMAKSVANIPVSMIYRKKPTGVLRMHWKQYFMLLIPFVVLGLALIYFLPRSQNHNAIITALIFWIIYYGWVYMEDKRKGNR